MKIALIQPPGWNVCAPPFNLALLKAVLKDMPCEVVCLDLNIELYAYVEEDLRKDIWSSESTGNCWFDQEFVLRFIERHKSFLGNFIARLIDMDPDIIGFTVINRTTLFVLEMAKMIKARQREKKIILGGPQCYRQLEGLKLINNPSVDAVCLGEAEISFRNLLDIARNKGDIGFCKGFIYRDKTGKIIDCGDPDIIEDLDTLPFPDFSDFDLERYTRRRLPIMPNKGCIFRCAFCGESVWMRRFRSRTPYNIFSEILFQLNMNPNTQEFQFNNSLINGDIAMLGKLCDLIIKDNIRITWGGQATIRKEMTVDFLKKLKKAGCTGLSYGVESGSNKILRLMNKGFAAELAEKVLRDTHEAGIHANFNIIVGFPGETEKELQETMSFLKRNSELGGSIFLSTLHVYGNSDLDRNKDKWGIRTLRSGEWESIDGKNNYEERLRRLEILKNAIEKRTSDDAMSIDLLAKLAG